MLDQIRWQIAADAFATVDELILNGWPREAAVDAVRDGYAKWWAAMAVEQTDFGADMWELLR